MSCVFVLGKLTVSQEYFDSLYNECVLFYNNEEPEISCDCFGELLKSDSLVSELEEKVFLAHAYLLMETGNTGKSQRILKKMLRKGYSNSTIYLYLARISESKSQPERNERILKEALNLFPDNLALLEELINYYIENQEYELVLKYSYKALYLDSTNHELYFAHAYALQYAGKRMDAIDSYKTAIELNPEYFSALYNLAVIYFNDAVEFMRKANNSIDDFDKYSRFMNNAEKNLKLALPWFEKAYKIMRVPEIKNSLQIIYRHFEMEEKLNELNEY